MRRCSILVVLAMLALLLAACGGEDEPLASSPSGSPPTSTSPGTPSAPASPSPSDAPSASPSPSARPDPEVAAFLALCSVDAAVAVEDLASAEATFHDEVHDVLHDLADELEDVDRGLSALLLQAKSKVEADFAEERIDVQILAADLTELTRATEAGLLALGFDPSGCPDQPQ